MRIEHSGWACERQYRGKKTLTAVKYSDTWQFSTLNNEEKRQAIAGWERRWRDYVDYIAALA